MKHFFFEEKHSWTELINDIGTDNKDYTEGIDEDFIAKCMRIYDAADVIYDRRVDPDLGEKLFDDNGVFVNQDDLLKFFFGKRESLSYLSRSILAIKVNKELLARLDNLACVQRVNGDAVSLDDSCIGGAPGSATVDEPGLMVKTALRCLWNYLLDRWTINLYGQSFDDLQKVYFYLTAGNICRRLSQCYYTMDRNFKEADIWGTKAVEMIWHGFNLCARQVEDDADNDELRSIYQLLNYQLGTHYLDYARRNRRSNYESAVAYFKDILQYVNTNYIEFNDFKRRYLLLYFESYRHCIIANQRRHRYTKAIDLAEACHAYIDVEPSNEPEDEWAVAADDSMYAAVLRQLGYYTKGAERDITNPRIRLLGKLDYARCKLNERKYEEAFGEAIGAIDLSNEIDKKSQGENHAARGHKNVDGILTASVAIRKMLRGIDDGQPLEETGYSQVEELCRNKCYIFSELRYYASNKHLGARCELAKWHCLYLEKPALRMAIRTKRGDNQHFFYDFPLQETIDEYLGGATNLSLQLYKALVCHHRREYEEAARILERITVGSSDQVSYIRPGSVGLKVKYNLANAYMKLGRHAKAAMLLAEINKTLRTVGELDLDSDSGSGGVYTKNPYIDERVIVDLSYCYIHEGNYGACFDLFDDYAKRRLGVRNWIGKKDKAKDKAKGKKRGRGKGILKILKEEPEQFLSSLNGFPRKAGKNNLLRCCIFLTEKYNDYRDREDKGKSDIYCEIVEYLLGNNEGFRDDDDCERALLEGYWLVLQDREPEAKERFEVASKKKDGYIGQYSILNMDGDEDKGAKLNRVEYISAYIICLIRLAKKSPDAALYEEIKDIINCIPTGYEISLKAGIELADWLVEFQEHENLLDGDSDRSLRDMCRSFSYVTLYSERGAAAFNQLGSNPSYRLLRPEYRGYILANLLSLYGPINRIKEYLTYNLEDKKRAEGGGTHLVHYTKLERLKDILGDAGAAEDGDSSGRKPQFWISNCGYVNDVTEGRVFIRNCRSEAYVRCREICKENGYGKKRTKSVTESEDAVFKNLSLKYFPQLERKFEEMSSNGSTVYTASVSVKEDSFPMWKIYADDERGCCIEFNEDFFDIKGIPYGSERLMRYTLSPYRDEDYPLYNVQYIGRMFDKHKRDLKYDNKREPGLFHVQFCGTRALKYRFLRNLLDDLLARWEALDIMVPDDASDRAPQRSFVENCKDAIRGSGQVREAIIGFVADRINEVRFLFKDADYEYEGEVRVVYNDNPNKSKNRQSYSPDIPQEYIPLDRDVRRLTVTLGSDIRDMEVDRIVTWLYKTGLVEKVKLARRNRYATEFDSSVHDAATTTA